MAKKISLVDDFDQETPASETIVFGIDGEMFSADLSEENAANLRQAIAPFLDVATRIGKFKTRPGHTPAKRTSPMQTKKSAEARARSVAPAGDSTWYKPDQTGSRKAELAKKEYRDLAKAWARKNGFTVGTRGQVSEEVYRAYEDYRRRKGMPTGPAAAGLT